MKLESIDEKQGPESGWRQDRNDREWRTLHENVQLKFESWKVQIRLNSKFETFSLLIVGDKSMEINLVKIYYHVTKLRYRIR